MLCPLLSSSQVSQVPGFWQVPKAVTDNLALVVCSRLHPHGPQARNKHGQCHHLFPLEAMCFFSEARVSLFPGPNNDMRWYGIPWPKPGKRDKPHFWEYKWGRNCRKGTQFISERKSSTFGPQGWVTLMSTPG